METERRCPQCGNPLPPEVSQGTCPACSLRATLEPEGETTPPDAVESYQVTIGFEPAHAGPVLEALSHSIGLIPRVLLPDTQPNDRGRDIIKPSSPEMPALADRGDRYQLFGEIARGGMGAILKGRDVNLGRDLAVKVLLEAHSDKPDLLRRFVEEAQIGGQLQHPGIVPVYELGTFADRRPYFTMKLVKGRTLATLLDERGRASAPSPSDTTPGSDATGLASRCRSGERGRASVPSLSEPTPAGTAGGLAGDLPRFLAIFEQVAQTVAYAHARNVIHRDLKPANIMVGSFGEVQVMDWGLAKVLKDGGAEPEPAQAPPVAVSVIRTVRSVSPAGESQSGSMLGTPAYMAPEQAGGDVDLVDRRADVFGLGSILCEILTGQPAYTGRTADEVMRKALRGDTADAFARLDACAADAELAALAKDCLACEPQDRPRDAGAVATRMTAYVASVQERLRLAEFAQVEAHARAEEEAKRRALSDQLAAEAQGRADEAGRRAQLERQRRHYQLGLAASVLLLSVLGGLSFTYWAHDRQARAARVELALKEATLLRSQAALTPEDVAKWEAAAKQLDAAKALAEGGEAETDRRLVALRVDVQAGMMAARRDRTLLDALADVLINQQDLGTAGTDAAYTRAFREAGLDVDGVRPAETGLALRSRPPSVVLAAAAALDDWALIRRQGKQPEARQRQPLEVARAADSDPFRDKVRAAILERDVKAQETGLRKLAAEPEAAVLPPTSAVLLASALRKLKAVEPAVTVLRAVVGRHPQDVWANYVLAATLTDLRPPAREEAVRYYTAARSLRPETAHALAHLLDEMGRRDEALTVFADLVARRPKDPCNLGCYGSSLKERGRPEAAAILDRAVAAASAAIRVRPDDGHARFHLGNALSAQGKADEAIATFREAIRVKPDDSLAHQNLGDALCSQGKLAEAAAEYRKAIRLTPDDADAHRGLGYTLSSHGKLEEAISEYRQAIRLKPDYVLAHNNLGYALLTQGKLDEAVAEYRAAIRLEPNDVTAHNNLGAILRDRKHDYDGAISEFRAATRLKPDDSIGHDNLGYALQNLGKLQEAIAEYREAIQINPNDTWAYYTLGSALLAQGNSAEAVAACRTAIQLAPKDADAHRNLGNALRVMGKLDEAIAEYRTVLRLKPDDLAAHNNLGAILCDQKHDYDGAIREFREAIQIEPNDKDAHHNLGVALRGQGKLDDGIAEFRTAIRLSPNDAKFHTDLGLALRAKGKLDEALAEFRETIRLQPDYVDGHDNLGYALQSQGKLGEAIAEYREAIRVDPKDAWAYYTLGGALLAQGKPAEAVAACRTAIRLKPDDADAYYNLGNALRGQGKLDEAMAAHRTAIRLKPDYVVAHHNLAHLLSDLGRHDDALREFREVVRLAPEHAEAQFDLARSLSGQGDYAGALAMYRKGHALASKQPGWQYPSAQWVADAERAVALAPRLPAVLRDEEKPKDTAEGLAFAKMAYDREQFASSARLYTDALAADQKLGDDREVPPRYDAACAAALAAAGQGKDDPPPTDAARSKLRQQALDWLKTERDAWAKLLDTGKPEARATVVQTIQHWQKDTDLAGVRDASALAKLPDAEQKGWHALWEGVESLLKKAQGPHP